MRLNEMTALGWGLLPVAALLCHCSSTYHTAPCDAGKEAGEPDTSVPPMDSGADGATSSFSFQPTNVALSAINAVASQAMAEDVASPCSIGTDTSSPDQDCFNTSGIEQVTQSDGSTANLIVVQSLKIETNGTIRVTGSVPLIIVSLSDVTISGSIDAHSADLSTGAGGAAGAPSNANGLGTGAGLAGSGAAYVGGGGGSYCGAGGFGGGQTTAAMTYGSPTLRPLTGGSSGGGGAVGSGAGGGAIQIVAAGTLTMQSGSYITVGGEGGPIAGIAADQNAGGGGSGGAILIEATSVSMGGILAANGGGGGGPYSGQGGADATPNTTPAAGGTGTGEVGGNGAAAGMAAGGNGAGAAGMNSGGGGGAAGWIRINTATGMATAGTTSPSPSPATTCSTVGQVRAMSAGP
jgi:hypothetical protein